MEATILNKIGTNSVNPYVTVDYVSDIDIAGSQGWVVLCDVVLPSFTIDGRWNQQIPGPTDMGGSAYGILLNSFAVACMSRNYTVRLFNKYSANPATYQNSIYEVLYYSGINLSKFDTTLGELVIINKDNPIMNKLYLHIINYDSRRTDEITFSLTYQVIQNKPIVL